MRREGHVDRDGGCGVGGFAARALGSWGGGRLRGHFGDGGLDVRDFAERGLCVFGLRVFLNCGLRRVGAFGHDAPPEGRR